jgi:hypothetical protein
LTTEIETIRRVLAVLQESEIEYMVVGSYAATLHGHMRTTYDLDLVVRLLPEQVSRLASALGEDFYLDVESAREAIERCDMFNAIDMGSGLKVDFWILKDDEFARTQFSRRQCVDFEGVAACVETAEDTILSKLSWYRITPSDRQLEDVRGILELQRDRLDRGYLRDWAKRQGVDDLLEAMSSG